jgi:hypothetical protein
MYADLCDLRGRAVAWVLTLCPDAHRRLLPDGRFRYDASSARLWLRVLEEWKEAKGQRSRGMARGFPKPGRTCRTVDAAG